MKALMEFNEIEGGVRPEQEIELGETLEKIMEFYETTYCVLTFELMGRLPKLNPNHPSYPCLKEHLSSKVTQSTVQCFIDNVAPNTYWDVVKTSLVINYLIQQSTEDEFILDFSELPTLDYIGCKLRNKSVKIISGNLGNYFGYGSKDCVFEAEEMGYGAGSNSEWSRYKAKKIGIYAGEESKNCFFEAKEIEDSAGQSSINCVFEADEIGENAGQSSINCVFEAEEPFEDINKRQDGTSRYFVNEKEREYRYYYMWSGGIMTHHPEGRNIIMRTLIDLKDNFWDWLTS